MASSTRYTSLCSLEILLLQNPVSVPFSCSGFPIPWYGVLITETSRADIFFWTPLFPDCFQKSNSFNALGENITSKA